MKTSDFNYDLPEDLIAKYPPNDRTDSRLLVFNDKEIKHQKFSDLLDYLQPNDLLVLNESAVNARVDYLDGLKENVIVGHKIPAGTGLRKYDDILVGSKESYDELMDVSTPDQEINTN